jgi:hypothetical protein
MRNVPLAPRLAQLSDSQLEQVIHRCHRRLVAAADLPSKAAAWRVLRQLVNSRSPEAIARLERERGLTARTSLSRDVLSNPS